MPRNIHAGALRRRAGHAGTAIAVDTRPRVITPKRGRGGYDRKAQVRADRKEQSEFRKPPKGGFFYAA